ncbi:MAG: 2-C-methyl-D-erythritol 4-phosphate cytidylyltransferase [Proteobacteria bacterium]|nr:2-C-methyl-D-erythritol 4-phosphate cytidylyltransferase [Pseudomonadota bacterium]
MPSPRFHVLIPSAGIGSRAGVAGPKQYEPLAGQALVGHTLDAFRALGARFATIALAVAPGDALVQRVLPDFPRSGERLLHVGGATRAGSVRNGLAALLADGAHEDDWVLVHDAARCLVTPAQIESLITACESDAVGGLLALPLPDTLKVATVDSRVQATLDRSDKWLAQTPQMFRLGALAAAIDQAGERVTDEASAIEAAGAAPRLVPGSAQNFKVTYPEDFALAAAVLASRRAAPP